MQTDEIYRENIGSVWGKIAIALFTGLSVLFVMLYIYQRSGAQIGDDPLPGWFYIMMFCIFIPVGALVVNFYSLTISATTSGITASYGLFRHRVAWSDISGYELDKGSAMKQYGGYGIRYGWRNASGVLVYNTTGSSLVLLEVKGGGYRYFGFSTKRPDEVMSLIKSNKR